MASGTIYDDVHHTMVNDLPGLLIPVVNEAFGENFTGEEKIVQGHNKRYLKKQEGETDKRITDSYFIIYGKEKVGRYHVENQSTPDSSMTKRMFEYDVQIALEDGKTSEMGLEVTIPKSAVIYLRSTKNTPDVLHTTIRTPGGMVTYDIPVLKVKDYSIDKIFEKKLLFFIPFHIFVYEKEFEEYNNTKERVCELQKHYIRVCQRLKNLVTVGEIDEYTRHCLMEMTMEVVNHIAAKYENIKKGIGEVMGGRVLDYEAKNIYNAGRNAGIQLGRSEGRVETYISLIKDSILSQAEAAKRLGMSEEEIKARM